MKNGGGTPRARFSAIRFLHLLEGRGDFEGKSFRIRELISAVKRKKGTNQRLPLNPEMLGRGKSKLDFGTPAGSEMCAVLMFGFHFAMRIGEVEKLEGRDISFDMIDGRPCATVHIRKSKNDQCKRCVYRTLVATGCDWCPVDGISQWLGKKMRHPLESKSVCIANVASEINAFRMDYRWSLGWILIASAAIR